MKERPILFNGEMVRAILEGRKTMTRRIVKPQPTKEDYTLMRNIESSKKKDKGLFFWGKFENYQLVGRDHVHFKCPFGNVGDRLWVRETFRYSSGSAYTPKDKEPKYTATIEYRSTYNNSINGDRGVKTIITDKMEFCGNLRKDLTVAWKPSIFMPRRASRINLEITNIRVERLKDISEKDAVREGVKLPTDEILRQDLNNYKRYFQKLWKSINGHDSWEYNPFVWVIEFKKV